MQGHILEVQVMTHLTQLASKAPTLIASTFIILSQRKRNLLLHKKWLPFFITLTSFSLLASLIPQVQRAMEDCNMIAADCVVISCCCCQCLVLQILVLVLLKLPYKLIRKTKKYVKRKFIKKPNREGNMSTERERSGYYVHGDHWGSFRIEGICLEEWRGRGNCVDEVEKVLEEMYGKGEFSFGSFWGGEDWEESFPPMYLVKQIECKDLEYKHSVTFGVAY